MSASVFPFEQHVPFCHETAWVAPGAVLVGQVRLGPEANVWYGSVLRGDVMPISVGARTNIQDGSVIHVTEGVSECVVGDDVTVGHRVILHGCRVGDRALIGMGSVVLDNAVIGEDSMVGAGSVVTPGTVIPPRVLALGSPCRVKRPLTDAEVAFLRLSAAHYVELARRHAASAGAATMGGPGTR